MRLDNLIGPVEHWARMSGARAAIIHKSGELTYSQLWMAVRRTADVFRSLEVMPGARVAVYLENRPETLIAALAVAAAGAIFIPVNHLLRTRQVVHILTHSGAGHFVTSAEQLKVVAPALREMVPAVTAVAIDYLPEDLGFKPVCLTSEYATASPASDLPATIDNDPAAILYTSGSTGLPKGVLLSHRNLLQGAFAVASYLEITCDDRLLCALPLSFDAGLNQAMTALVSGATAVLYNYLRAADLVRQCADMGITGLTGVPPLWIDLSNAIWPQMAAARFRYFANTGGSMPEATLRRLRSLLPNAKPYLMYGLTEAFRSAYLHPALVDEKPGSVGKAIPNARVTVRRADGTLCEAGEVGELVHVGAGVALGYWNDPEGTATRFRTIESECGGLRRSERAVWSGDLFTQDPDGFLYFVGRNDEMIKTAGYRVSPTEIEQAVLAGGAVREAVAVGVPDFRNGQVIGLVVVAAFPDADETALQDMLMRHCRRRLPNYMVPARIAKMPEIPRSPNGKFDRTWCRELFITDCPRQASA